MPPTDLCKSQRQPGDSVLHRSESVCGMYSYVCNQLIGGNDSPASSNNHGIKPSVTHTATATRTVMTTRAGGNHGLHGNHGNGCGIIHTKCCGAQKRRNKNLDNKKSPSGAYTELLLLTHVLGMDNRGASTIAIDNKIEQAMDLVKSHLMFAVREEVLVLKEQIKELVEKNTQLEYENNVLRANATQETLTKLSGNTGGAGTGTASTTTSQAPPPSQTSGGQQQPQGGGQKS